MKKLFISLFMLLTMATFGQNKTIQFGNYFTQIDTSINLFESNQMPNQPSGVSYYSLYVNSGYTRLWDCYKGKVFVFTDTLRSNNIAQIGTTGKYRITSNTAPLVTTKRNILVGSINTIVQYDSNVYSCNASLNELPFIITNIATGKVVAIVNEDVIIYNGSITPQVFQSIFIKIVL